MCGFLVAEVVFEPCNRPGGVRETLLPFAVLALCGYCIAYPCALMFILYRNRMKIMEDQLLRAENRGETRLENPHCYELRKMYHKCVWVLGCAIVVLCRARLC